jgi:ribose transport system permease protein
LTVATDNRRAAPSVSLHRRIARHALGARESGVFVGLLALCVFGALGTNGFLGTDNLLNVAQQVSLIGIMAVGMTFVIVTGEIDLSVGSIYALAATVSGLLISHGHSPAVAVLAGLATGAAAGFVNGALTVKFGLPSFIVTLGTLGVFRGIALLISQGAPISLESTDPGLSAFNFLGQGKIAGIPMQFVCLIAVAAGGLFILRYSRFGFQAYAVGGSRVSARLCGLPVDRVRLVSFTLLGLLSGFAGIISLSFLSYVQGGTGVGLELTVITTVIVGGAALFGGSGTMLGTVLGVFLIGVLQNLLALKSISSFWQQIAVGVVIIVAVGIDTKIRGRQGV